MKRIAKIALAAAAAAGAGLFIAGRAFSAPRYAGPPSDHFDGREFRPLRPIDQGGLAMVRWMLTRGQGPWAEWVDADAGPAPPQRVGQGELRVTFVNHATVLIQMDGVLDPGVRRGAGLRRNGTRGRVAPIIRCGAGLRLASLPR